MVQWSSLKQHHKNLIYKSIIFFITRKILREQKTVIRYKDAFSESKSLLKFSLPALLSGFIVFPTNWFTMTLLAKSSGGFSEVGAYNAANQWYNVLIFIPYIVVSTFLPVFSEMLSKGNIKKVKKTINSTIFLLSVIFLTLSFIFFLFGDSIALIYGNQFKGIGCLFALAVFTVLPQSLNIVIGNLVAATDKMWFGLLVNLFWCLSFMGFTQLLILSGARGLLFARIISYSISLIPLLYFYFKWSKKIEISNDN